MIILLPWSFFNMGDGSVVALTAPGLEYEMPNSRQHFTIMGRLHYSVREQD